MKKVRRQANELRKNVAENFNKLKDDLNSGNSPAFKGMNLESIERIAEEEALWQIIRDLK